MSKETLFWGLYLSKSTSEIVVMGFLGQPVTLPCLYPSWSQDSNSMCWGKGRCPNSGCNEELIHTDGTRVTSRKSAKYRLWGTLQRGNVSLTILNPSEGDSGVYCCRIEVPGWFNDVKLHRRLQLQRAPTTSRTTTTHKTTTTSPTTPQMTTTTAALPTVMTTPDLTTRTPLPTTAITVLTTADSCPSPTPSTFPEAATGLLTPEPSKEGPILTAESETVLPRDHWSNAESTSADTVLLTSKGVQTLTFSTYNRFLLFSFPASERAVPEQNKTTKTGQMDGMPTPTKNEIFTSQLLTIIVPSLGFVLLALLVAFIFREKLMEINCLQRHTRLGSTGDSKNVLNDTRHGSEDEDGLFTL
uniref:T cell immunoglobulin and mucin domain containing 4 n=1 Tax=Aotus nancymaae TaxID=37293 RepID=A0A2K5EA64_AOTNA